MQKKDILNLGLLAFVIMLASVIYLSKEESFELNKLTDIDIDNINSIAIRHNENVTTIVRNSNNQWQITRPVNIAANNFRINTILKLANAPVHNQYSPAEIDLRESGLENTQTRIRLNEQTIELGIINPVTNLRYVKLNNRVNTIEDVYFPLITSHFGTLVSLNLLPANSDIEKIVLPQQTFYKDDEGIWRSNTETSADDIIQLVQHWKNDQAFGVHSYMTRKDLGEILVYLSGHDQPLKFSISDTEPWLILARTDIGLEYHLDRAFYGRLVNPSAHNQ